jgi:transcriptional regulator with XRE-family HTH domain
MNARFGADELRRRRLELRLTRRELARRAAVDLSVIEDAEIHGIPIYDHTASLLAAELGIDTSHLPQPPSSSSGDVEMLGAVLADLGIPIATQTIAAALAWSPKRVRDAAKQLQHELQPLGQTVTLSPGDQLGLAPFASCISDEQRAAVHREALTIDHATAEVLLAILRGRRDERSWNKLADNQRSIAMELVAAGSIIEDHGTLAPTEYLADAFHPGQLFGLDW